MEDPNPAHYKISNRVSQVLIFFLLVVIYNPVEQEVMAGQFHALVTRVC